MRMHESPLNEFHVVWVAPLYYVRAANPMIEKIFHYCASEHVAELHGLRESTQEHNGRMSMRGNCAPPFVQPISWSDHRSLVFRTSTMHFSCTREMAYKSNLSQPFYTPEPLVLRGAYFLGI
jgi:hypothetical protein